MANLTSRATTVVNADPARVWEAITAPALIKRWFFGVDTETDWTEGSPVVHRGEYRGQPYVDRGTVLRFVPNELLVHTHWSSVSGLPDRPENYQTVTWALTPRDAATELTVTDENIPSEEAKVTSDQGWAAALAALKDLLEAKPDDR